MHPASKSCQLPTVLSTCRLASGDTSTMPSAWRWQKRFFIFSDTQRTMYYFKSSEEVQKGVQARGIVSVRGLVL